MTIQIKGIEQYVTVVMFTYILLYKVVLTSELRYRDNVYFNK